MLLKWLLLVNFYFFAPGVAGEAGLATGVEGAATAARGPGAGGGRMALAGET